MGPTLAVPPKAGSCRMCPGVGSEWAPPCGPAGEGPEDRGGRLPVAPTVKVGWGHDGTSVSFPSQHVGRRRAKAGRMERVSPARPHLESLKRGPCRAGKEQVIGRV